MAMLTDETIVAYVNECLVQGLPTNVRFDLRSESLASELRLDVRFETMPREINLSALLLQIRPPELQGQAPEIATQILRELGETGQATLTGNYNEVRPVTISFSAPMTTFRCVVCDEAITLGVSGTTNQIEEVLQPRGWYKGGAAYYCPSHSAHLFVICSIQDFIRTNKREPKKIYLTKDMEQNMDETRKREAKGDKFKTVAQDGKFDGKEIVFGADTFRLE
jgi:hypothetical protein